MYRPRIIPVLLLQEDNSLVKTEKFRRPTYIGDPINAVRLYNDMDADEIVFLDINASREGRCIDLRFVQQVGEEANMPFAVGGGIRKLGDIQALLAAGSEKVILGTYALENPQFVREAADRFGSSTIAVCIDVKKKLLGGLKVWGLNASKAYQWSPKEFALLMQEMGAGEIIVQSVERDGAMQGYDVVLTQSICEAVSIPVIALGGAGNLQHLRDLYRQTYANGLAAGSLFVYQGTMRGVLINYPDGAAKQSIYE